MRARSLCLAEFDLRLVRLEEERGGWLVAISILSSTITDTTLRRGFPRVIITSNQKEEIDKNKLIAAKLLGKRIETASVTRFSWDDAQYRVATLQFQADLVTLLLRILSSLEHVESVFRDALISQEGRVAAPFTAAHR
ncbi:hypothetical protein ON010_g8222 [Phytophthora cinnamomi]|nr:hypothetical protein ON010_g8222 [Phytophthora cinnamomi]